MNTLHELFKRKSAIQRELIDVQMAITKYSEDHPTLYECPNCGAQYRHDQGFTHWLNQCVEETLEK